MSEYGMEDLIPAGMAIETYNAGPAFFRVGDIMINPDHIVMVTFLPDQVGIQLMVGPKFWLSAPVMDEFLEWCDNEADVWQAKSR